MTCITICKNPQYIRPSRADTGFCSCSALASRSWHFFSSFYSFGSIEVGVLWRAYSYSKITPNHSFFGLMQPEVLFKRDPLRKFFLTAWCVADNYTCKLLRASQLGAPAYRRLLCTPKGQPDRPSYFSFSLFFQPQLSLAVSERSLWLREGLRAGESTIYQSEELTGITETISVGATFHRRTGTNKNTRGVDCAFGSSQIFSRLRSPALPRALSLFEWMMGTSKHLWRRLCNKDVH